MKAQASVAKGATSLYVANVVVLASNTLYFLVLTNFLKSTLNVGIVTALNIMIWLLVTVSILAQPVTLQSPIPAPISVLKFIPELITRHAAGGARRLYLTALAFTALIGGVAAAVLVILPVVITPLIGGPAVSGQYVQLSGIDVLLLSLAQICVAALISLGDTSSATAYLILWSAVRYSLASILLLTYSITGVLIGWIIGDAVFLAFALRKSIRVLPGGRGKRGFSLSDLMRYSIYTLLSAIMGFAISQADKIFTLARQGLPELAVYNVAIVAASFSAFAPYALLTVLLPALSSLYAARKKQQMREMIGDYTRYVSLIVIPIAIGFASITQVALRIFGPEYVSGLVPSVVVSVATGLTAVGAVYAAALLALGELRWFTAANILGLLGLLIVSYVLTPLVGLAGPAFGRAALMTLVAVVYGFSLARKGFFEMDLGAFITASAGSAIMGVVVFFVLSLPQSFPAKLALLPVMILLGAGIYLGSLRVLHVLTVRDLEFIQDLMPARLHAFLPMAAKLAGLRWKAK